MRTPVAHRSPARRLVSGWLAGVVVTVALVLVAEQTSHGRSIVSSVQKFLLFYAGVFALIGLTAAVGVGLLATDRIVMKPGHRVVAQAVHRGVSLAALTALAVHIVLEILAHRSHVIDAFVPFLAQDRTLYIGLGTIASDLVVLIVVTGFLRGRFASKWPWAWRSLHALAYLCWPLSIVHGLLGGRTAHPYVDWSYGACLAGVAMALGIRLVATLRHNEEKLAHPVPDRLSVPAEGLIPGTRVSMAPLAAPQPYQRALPAAPTGAYSGRGMPPSGQMTRPGLPSPDLAAAPDWADAQQRAGLPGWAGSRDRGDSQGWASPPDRADSRDWGSPPDRAGAQDWASPQNWAGSQDWTSPQEQTSPQDWAGSQDWSASPGGAQR